MPRKARRYACSMAKFPSRYPDRAAGAALFLLRLSGASTGFAQLSGRPAILPLPGPMTALACGLPLLLILGFTTRFVALLLALLLAAGLCTGQQEAALLAAGHVCLCVALALLGPGAYSVDAKIFGRRVILFEARFPDRGSER